MSRSIHPTPTKLLLGCSLTLLMSHQALGVGLMVNPTSHLTGIANAGSAVYDHSTAAVITNPAAMSLMSEKQVGGTLTLLVPDWSVNEKWDCNAENNCAKDNVGEIAIIPAMGLIRPMGHGFTWGIGLGGVSGQGLKYGDNWKGRAIVRDNSLQVVELINSVSWRMNDAWTFGAGVGALYGSFGQKQDLPSLSASAGDDLHSIIQFVGLAQDCRGLTGPALALCLKGAVDDSGLDPESAKDTIDSLNSYLDGESGTKVDLEGDDFGVELVLGTTWEFLPGHRLGLVYKYYSDFTFEGNAKIKGQLLSDETYQRQHMTLDWDMPERLILSGSHQLNDGLIMYWDVERVFYDEFERTDLRIDGLGTTKIDRNFKDANRYAIGTEYALNDRITLQLGASYDESPVDDSDRMPDIPVDEITKVAIGTIYQMTDQLNVEAFLTVEFLGDAEIEQLASIDGHKIGESVKLDADTTLYVFGVSFGYKF
jgi:long-chain fatty acid transport protein